VEASVPATAFSTLLPSLARDFDQLAAVAATDIPVLLMSETGTGKEVIARALHDLSRRRGPFLALNCGALATTLAESLLFGHKRGAFSGAAADHVGLLRSADEGTLLLDELGDMPPALQPTLLRALQEGEVLPLGATAPVRFSARVVAATHVDIDALAATGAFREDLLARLAGFVFRLPPLRERREDIGLLTAALVRKSAEPRAHEVRLSAEAATLLFRYGWPRNVRELEKCLTRAALFAGAGPIEAAHLPPEIRGTQGPGVPAEGPKPTDRKARLLELLALHHGNVQAVADALGTSRSQVHRSAQKLGIDLAAYRR
jgi:transcriptional regulator with GAF, ATPase, and Fis domain